MRTSLIFAGLVLCVSLSLRAEPTGVPTPQTLSGWTLAGADLKTIPGSGDLFLPARAQLARIFGVSDLALKITTTPVIGESPADWPVLELGSAALVFARNEKNGRLVLVLGETAPLDLPFTFPLDAEGRSTESLGVVFEKHGAAISVTFSGETQQIPLVPAAAPLELVISSGVTQPWIFEHFDLVIGSAGMAGQAEKGNASRPGTKETGLSRPALSVVKAANDAAANSSAARSAGTASAPASAPDASVELEIFTPPAVRYGRADSVRLSAAQFHKK